MVPPIGTGSVIPPSCGQRSMPKPADVPPSTCSTCPVIERARSEDRNSTALARSSVVGGVCNGMYILKASVHHSGGTSVLSACTAGGRALKLPALGVVSGAMTLMRIPYAPSSQAMALEKLVVAPLAPA